MGRRTGTPLPKSWRVDQVGCLVGFFDRLCFLCLFSYLAFFLKEIKEVAPIHLMHVVLLRACVDFLCPIEIMHVHPWILFRFSYFFHAYFLEGMKLDLFICVILWGKDLISCVCVSLRENNFVQAHQES